MHIRPQRAHDRVEGPVFVCVVICSWQLKQVKLTGPSDNSVGTTSWVATEGGAVCWGPKSANWNVCIYYCLFCKLFFLDLFRFESLYLRELHAGGGLAP